MTEKRRTHPKLDGQVNGHGERGGRHAALAGKCVNATQFVNRHAQGRSCICVPEKIFKIILSKIDIRRKDKVLRK